MTLHLIKLCVGIDDVDHLARVQARRLADAKKRGEPAVLRHFTRMTPRRRDELLDGGSLYWVIKGVVRVRQRLVGIEDGVNARGQPCCVLLYDPRHVRTQPRAHRPFQGWRYLKPDDAPPDLGRKGMGEDELPAEMAAELRGLGLI